MANRGQHIINKWRSAWTTRLALSCLVWTIALTVFLSALLIKFTSASRVWIALVMIVSAIIAYLLFYRKISAGDVASYIDKSFPPAEDSTSLLLKPEQELNYFEKRQVEKINSQWADKITIPPGINKRLRLSIAALTTAAVLAIVIFFIPIIKSLSETNSSNQPIKETSEKRMAGISSVSMTVIPPKYTGRPAREQSFLNVRVEEDGVI